MTFGSMHAGTTNNVIAETAYLTWNHPNPDSGHESFDSKRVQEMARGIATFDLEVDVTLKQGGYFAS